MDLLERIDAASSASTPVWRAAGGAAAKIRAMVEVLDGLGVSGSSVDELRSLLVGALACAEAGEDWRRDGARVIELCEAVAASVPLEGLALWKAVLRILGGEVRDAA